jgi:hypothetical protein
MRLIEKALIGVSLGITFPVIGFIIGWWSTFSFLPDRLILLSALAGLLVGIIVDCIFLKKWVNQAYICDLKFWMAIYLFYSICVFGFFMGVPVFQLVLAFPAGLYIGSRLAHCGAVPGEVINIKRRTCIFTTAVLSVLCAASAVLALTDPYTSANLQGMLGLHFEVTRPMLVALVAFGGTVLLALQWVVTGTVITRTHDTLLKMYPSPS